VVPQGWASWFEWAAPGIPVMVDSRIEVEPASAWADYLVIAAGGSGALQALARTGATLVVVDRSSDQGALLSVLEAPGSGWRIVTQDADGVIFRPAPKADLSSDGCPMLAAATNSATLPPSTRGCRSGRRFV
jgi:hypothetical protein